jgi:hypothetical protein
MIRQAFDVWHGEMPVRHHAWVERTDQNWNAVLDAN